MTGGKIFLNKYLGELAISFCFVCTYLPRTVPVLYMLHGHGH